MKVNLLINNKIWPLSRYGLLSVFSFFMFCQITPGAIIDLKSKSTVTVVELNKGDIINFTLKSGRIVTLKLVESSCNVLFTNLNLPSKSSNDGFSVFKMDCIFNIDEQEMRMVRYAPAQESFYEPYVVNGLRIWFDAVKSLSEYFNENHGECLPGKDVRIVLQDATSAICPEKIGNWCLIPNDYLDVKNCYRGDDTWLGPWNGTDLHGGLDIDMPSNAPLWAPLSLDNNYYFNTVTAGQNNNRWRSFKYWDNGDTWIMQTHHVNQLIVPELQSIPKGTKYAYSAGTCAWASTHTHFFFRIVESDKTEYNADPWILFWQIFENKKIQTNSLKADIKPLIPAKTGDMVMFDGSGSQTGTNTEFPEYYWSFGDGGFAVSQRPVHVYQNPGIYPVTLTLSDGINYSKITQHITINGVQVNSPELRISQENNYTFNLRKPWEMDVYNEKYPIIPNTVTFYAPHQSFSAPDQIRKSIPPQSVSVQITGMGKSLRGRLQRMEVQYVIGNGWLNIEPVISENSMTINLKPDINKLNTEAGETVAYLILQDNRLINSPYIVRVVVNFSRPADINEKLTIIDNQDPDCVKSNYFWLTVRPNPSQLVQGIYWTKSYKDGFLISSNNSDDGFVRYLPKLQEGKYKISLYSPLFSQDIFKSKINGFYVNVRSKEGLETKWINPNESLEIGEFDFPACDGYVEIVNKNSKGLVIADAIIFEKIEN